MFLIKWIVIVIFVIVVSAIAAGQAGLLQGKTPTDLGVKTGKLKGLSSTDNSVSSQANLYPDHPQSKYSSIAPLPVRGDGPTTMTQVKGIVVSMRGTKLVTSEPDYLYAQYTTPLMKYVDDVEFWFNPNNNTIEVRSASRLGESDFGLNRKRIEAVRAALTTVP